MLQDPVKTKNEIVEWIRNYFEENGKGCKAVIGISGGKDSSIAAALCAEALGKDRVIGVLMPNGVQSDISDSRKLVDFLGIPYVELNIADAYQGMMNMLASNKELLAISGRDGVARDTEINLPPRLRMATLYAVGQMLPSGARVVNTCNASEDYVGYSTKYGDAAGDFSPLSHLLVHEVRQIGDVLGLPKELVHKVPSDGLCGQDDEQKLGFTYACLDEYILTGICEDPATKERIDRLHRINLHKLQLMPAFEPGAEERTSPQDGEKTCYIADSAVITGDVEIGEDASIWHGVLIRGDLEKVVIGKGSNIQDGCVLHVEDGCPLIIGDNVSVGHGAILHGCTIGDGCLIGMGSIILSHANIGENSMVGAGSLVTGKADFPAESLSLGSPAKAVRPLLPYELDHLKENSAEYRQLSKTQLPACSAGKVEKP